MNGSGIDQINPPVGPNIVRAWFDSAINPLLLGLQNECAILRKHTFTWREHSGQMLVIRSVRGHVPLGWANFEQFLFFYGDITEFCKNHDVFVMELAVACHNVVLRSTRKFRVDRRLDRCSSHPPIAAGH